jgi:glycosyltransferase involved in cell wall biosynthesis
MVLNNKKLRILILNWKDKYHPQAGGAEYVTDQIAQRMVKDGHKVTLLTARYAGSSHKDNIEGVKIIRAGKNKFSHYIVAWWHYLRHLRNQNDIIVEEINTSPYLINLIKGQEKVVLYYNQLCREVWFYQFPVILSHIGYVIEPIYTWLLSRFGNQVLTISQSSKQDLVRFGFDSDRINLFSMGIENKPLSSLKKSLAKEQNFTILFHGSLRQMKRPMEVLKAFEIVQKKIPKSRLWISGGGDQQPLKDYAIKNKFDKKIKFFGRTGEQEKLGLMQKSHVLCATSIKEGWGLIVTEANSMGTPAISYDVDGLRDSTGMGNWQVVDTKPEAMATALVELAKIVHKDPDKYQQIRQTCLKSAKQINFDRGYKEFMEVVEKAAFDT